jgi:hypothetical protein
MESARLSIAIFTASNMIMKALALTLLLSLPTALPAKATKWKDATVAATTEGSANADSSAEAIWLGIRIEQNCLGYRIESEDTIYILEYCPTPPDQHFWSHGHYSIPKLTTNGKIKITADIHEAYILDDSGKKFKTTLMQTAAKNAKGKGDAGRRSFVARDLRCIILNISQRDILDGRGTLLRKRFTELQAEFSRISDLLRRTTSPTEKQRLLAELERIARESKQALADLHEQKD